MKKEELIAALREVRTALKSDDIVKAFSLAWSATISTQQQPFGLNVMTNLVEGTGNFPRLSVPAREICKQLQILPYYEGSGSQAILHHIARAKGSLPAPNNPPQGFQPFLKESETLFFVEAHRRVVTASDLIDRMLHAERPDGELLLEGDSPEGGPSLNQVQEVLSSVSELIQAYGDSRGESNPSKIEISYLDLGSNYQIGIKVDGKAEVGVNLTRFLTEMFRWVTNPRAYMRERRAEGITKEIAVLADLKKRVEEGEITADTADLIAARLLGCGHKLASLRVFPASLVRERTNVSPTAEILNLMDEAATPPALPTPLFTPKLLDGGRDPRPNPPVGDAPAPPQGA